MANIVNPLIVVNGGTLDSHTFTNNGTYTPTSVGQAVDGWNEITVSVSSPTPTGKYIKFYDEYGLLHTQIDTSLLPLESLPELPESIEGYTFSWNKTLQQVNTMENGGVVGTNVEVESTADTYFIFGEEGIPSGQSIMIFYSEISGLSTDAIIDINWGDGSYDRVTVLGSGSMMHTYNNNNHNPIFIQSVNNIPYYLSNTSSDKGIFYVEEIRVGGNVFLGVNAFSQYRLLKKVILPNGCLTSYPDTSQTTLNLFYNCPSILGVSMPNLDSHFTTLSNGCFNNCSNVKAILFMGTNSVTTISDGSCFSGCSSLETLVLPQGLVSIGNGAFSSCLKLKNITLNNITTLGTSVFSGCESLESVSFGNNSTFTELGSNVFKGCHSLKEISLDNTITTIGSSAFEGCATLNKVEIGENVTEIKSYAFKNCYSLQEIKIHATTPPTLGSSAIPQYSEYNFPNTCGCTFYVPSASLSTYKSASGWSSYANLMKGF